MYQSALNRSRNDKFIMVLDLPKVMKDLYDNTLEDKFKIDKFQTSIYGSPIPTVSVPAVTVAYGGQTYKTSSFARPAYNPLTIKFLVDNGYKNYWILWNWLNLFNDSKNSDTNTESMKNYTSDFTIFGLDEFNNKIISFEYTNAFPISLSEISFSNQDPTEINSTVTFEFNQLQVNLINNVDEVNC